MCIVIFGSLKLGTRIGLLTSPVAQLHHAMAGGGRGDAVVLPWWVTSPRLFETPKQHISVSSSNSAAGRGTTSPWAGGARPRSPHIPQSATLASAMPAATHSIDPLAADFSFRASSLGSAQEDAGCVYLSDTASAAMPDCHVEAAIGDASAGASLRGNSHSPSGAIIVWLRYLASLLCTC